MTFDEVRVSLLRQEWVFAKTMPDNPHWYTLRRKWSSDDEFVEVVRFIRSEGYEHVYEGWPYVQLDVDDHFYWTMGAPIAETILINRKLLRCPHDDAEWSSEVKAERQVPRRRQRSHRTETTASDLGNLSADGAGR